MHWALPEDLPTSGIREILDRALHIPHAIRLETGEPNFPPDPEIIEAFARAAAEGHNRYTSSRGLLPLREALSQKIAAVNRIHRSPEEILITPGGSPGLFVSFMGTLQPGDDLLVPDPGWPDYLGGVQALHIHAVPYPLEAPAFWPDVRHIEGLLTPRTRAIVVNFPGNPTGSIPPRAVMEDLVEMAERHDLWIISDEVYDQIVYSGSPTSCAALAPERTLSVYSFSKTYAMTGWRLGYVAGPAQAVDSLNRVAMGLWSSVSEPLQYSGMAALKMGGPGISKRLEEYRARKDFCQSLLQEHQLAGHSPQGAFYLLINISAARMASRDFALRLLHDEHIAVAPGSAFGSVTADYIRISLASSLPDLSRGVTRLCEILTSEKAGPGLVR